MIDSVFPQQAHRQGHEHCGIRVVRVLVVAQLVGEPELVLLLWAVVLHMHAVLARLGLSQDEETRVPEVGARQPALRMHGGRLGFRGLGIRVSSSGDVSLPD